MISQKTLNGFDPDEFLKHYWQQKPLLIRQAFPHFESPISADELAGLACEPEVNARIVIEKGGDHPWQAMHGPFDEETFAQMSDSFWTLVVNDVEKYLPEFSQITDQFRFIPEWFLDDLMISWAADQGSVGPHVDLYDVFILQASGSRRWQISQQPIDENNYIPDIALRLLKDFYPEQEWVLNPGDMIYLPAGVSHHGVSLGESISFSIGFRATSHHDLVNEFIAGLTQNLPITKTLKMPLAKTQPCSNEIQPAVIEQLREIFKTYLDPNHPALSEWFGRYVSDPKADFEWSDNPHEVQNYAELLDLGTLYRNPASRFAFIREDKSAKLFIDGELYEVRVDFAEMLCEKRMISLTPSFSEAEKGLLVELFNKNNLILSWDE